MKNQSFLSSILMGVLAVLFFSACKPDLVVEGLAVTWTPSERNVSFKVHNIGQQDAGEFMVYVNLEEDPVSPNHRPQHRENVIGLAKGATLEFNDLDLSYLAHPDNNFLGNVYKIVVVADPKSMVAESNESNNEMEEAVSPMSTDCYLRTDFHNMTVGTTYTVGSSFNSNTVDFELFEFKWYNNNVTTTGEAKVDNNSYAGCGSPDIWTNNINLKFLLPGPVNKISFCAGYYGGNMNIGVNGINYNKLNSIADVQALSIPGVPLHVTITGSNTSTWEFNGPITEFFVGGQEFAIDNVCIK